jgi:hypothetical protein
VTLLWVYAEGILMTWSTIGHVRGLSNTCNDSEDVDPSEDAKPEGSSA